jgi:hypothetical protein
MLKNLFITTLLMLNLTLVAGNIKIGKITPYSKIEKLTILSPQSFKVITLKATAGAKFILPVAKGRVYDITLSAIGDTNIQLGINSGYGFNYSRTTVLDETTPKAISFKHYSFAKGMTVYVYSCKKTKSTFTVKSIKCVEVAKQERDAEKIENCTVKAFEYLSKPGKIVKDSSEGKVVAGGSWWRPVTFPAPQTSLPLFFYIKANYSGKDKAFLTLMNKTQPIGKGYIKQNNVWGWIKIGPVPAEACGEQVSIRPSCKAHGAPVKISTITISTNSAFVPEK